MWTTSITNFFPSFSLFNKEFESGNRLIDLFSDHFSFHFHSSNSKNHIKKLDKITFSALLSPFFIIVVSDVSIKNHVATSILHIHSYNEPVVKTLHRAINITTTEAELFAIQCRINQAISNQIYSAAISQELRDFFSRDPCNYIEFQGCPSKQRQPLHYLVDKDTKQMVSSPLFPYKLSQDFCRKMKCDIILSQQRILFQVLDVRGKNFLDLLDDDLNPLKSSSIKGGPWLQHFGHSNLLCTHLLKAIMNHAPIGEY